MVGPPNSTRFQPPSSGLFGAQNTTTSKSLNLGLFGASNPTVGQSGLSSLPNSTVPQSFSSGLFGATARQSSNSGLFGITNPAVPQSSNTGLFGSSTVPQSSSLGLFGAQNSTKPQSFKFGMPSSTTPIKETGRAEDSSVLPKSETENSGDDQNISKLPQTTAFSAVNSEFNFFPTGSIQAPQGGSSMPTGFTLPQSSMSQPLTGLNFGNFTNLTFAGPGQSVFGAGKSWRYCYLFTLTIFQTSFDICDDQKKKYSYLRLAYFCFTPRSPHFIYFRVFGALLDEWVGSV